MPLDLDTDSWSDTEIHEGGDAFAFEKSDAKKSDSVASEGSSSSLTERTVRINKLEESIKEMTDSFNYLKEHENENKNNNNIVVNVNTNQHDDDSSSSSSGCWAGFLRCLPRCILAIV